MCIYDTEIQTIWPISLKFRTLEEYDQGPILGVHPYSIGFRVCLNISTAALELHAQSREPLLNRKAQNSWPHFTNGLDPGILSW